MAVRKKLNHDDATRGRIQTSQLLNRLNAHVFSGAEMSQTQLKAAEILLKKTLPDLAAIQHSGDEKNPVTFQIITGVPRASTND